MGRDRPRTGLSPVLPRHGRSPRRPTPNDQSSLVTEEEASRLPHRAVRGHRQVGRTQSEVVQGSTANGSQDVFGAAPFTTTHLPPQLSKGFDDSFSDHPVSAFTSEVTSDVIQVGDQGIPPVCSPDPFGAPRFVHRPPSQSENESEDITAPNTTQAHSRHQRTDSLDSLPL